MQQTIDSRIRVLQYICPTGYYGAERWIVALAKNLDTRAVRCDLVLPVEKGADYEQIIANFPQSGATLFQIPSEGRIDFSLVRKLVDLIKHHKIDVLHTHGYKSDITGILAARRAGIPCISTPHGFGLTSSLKLKAYIALDILALRFFDLVVPLSPKLVELFRGKGFGNNRLRFIANGVDTTEIDAFRLSREPLRKLVGEDAGKDSNNKIFKFGYVGRLAEGKEIDQMILAFNNLWLENPSVCLELVGEGPLRSDLVSLVNGLPSREAIVFAGFQADRFEFLSNFDAFVMTSKSEGIPRSMMEAMAMGVPVIAYDIPGVDQLVTHEQTGLLSPFGDKAHLLENMKVLISDTEKHREFSKAGKAHIEKSYSAKSMAESYTDLYRYLLNVN